VAGHFLYFNVTFTDAVNIQVTNSAAVDLVSE
jgi:hypothetical protein